MKIIQIIFFQILIQTLTQCTLGQWLVGGIPNTEDPLGPFSLSELLNVDVPRNCIRTPKGRRCYFTYIPKCAGLNSPLVYSLSGFSNTPYMDSQYSGWMKIAEEKCVVVVWPVPNVRLLQTDEACWAVPATLSGISNVTNREIPTIPCCCSNIFGGLVLHDKTNDIAFLRSIAYYIVKDAPEKTDGRVTVNTKRIYMTGISNGCMMAYAMAMEHSDFVAAVGCLAGSILTDATDDYIPTPMWIVHGKLDPLITYDQGLQFYLEDELVGAIPEPQASYDYLFSLNNCSITNTTFIAEGNIQYASGCANNASVEFLTLDEGGHRLYPGIDTSYNTTSAAWEFCSRYESLEEPVLEC